MYDITELKKDAQALKESEEKYRILSDDAIMPIVIHDISGNIKYLNKSAIETMKANNVQKALNTPIINFVHHDYAEETVKIIKKLFEEEKEVFYKEQKFKRFDGEYIDVDVFGKLIDHNNEKAIQLTFNDITDRKKAERDLLIERDNLKNIFEAMEDGIYIVNQQFDIQYVNPVLKKEFGSYQGKKCYEYFHNRNKTCDWCKNKDVMKAKTVRWEWYSERAKKTYDLIDTPITNYDGTISKLEIFRDITDRKKTEKEIKKQNKQLKELNATKDKFFSIIAHDLKSPFSAILGFSNILVKNHKKYDDEKREKMISAVNNSANSAFKLLENLLTWARSQSGVIKYLPEKLHLKILLFETMFDLQAQADKKNIIVLDAISENDIIFADNNMLATILRNLISNAIKFTSNSGTIIISSEKQENSNFIEISVEDTGVGIPKDTIDNLFRIDKNTSTQGTENETGTGLGLILCKEFVEKHNGKIWVESEEGKASTFSFTIPCIY